MTLDEEMSYMKVAVLDEITCAFLFWIYELKYIDYINRTY
jgi:hypothetical protein